MADDEPVQEWRATYREGGQRRVGPWCEGFQAAQGWAKRHLEGVRRGGVRYEARVVDDEVSDDAPSDETTTVAEWGDWSVERAGGDPTQLILWHGNEAVNVTTADAPNVAHLLLDAVGARKDGSAS